MFLVIYFVKFVVMVVVDYGGDYCVVGYDVFMQCYVDMIDYKCVNQLYFQLMLVVNVY